MRSPIVRTFVITLLLQAGIALAEQQIERAETFANPLDVYVADPFVIRHGGTYYLYGTSAAHFGFEAWSSQDLINWRNHGFIYTRREGEWPQRQFWAPEMFHHHGKWYLHFSAKAREGSHRLVLATGDSPLGPFTELQAPWFDPGFAVIDGNIFRDDDDRLYLYYVRDVEEHTSSDVYVRPLSDDLLSFTGDAVMCITPSQQWEGTKWNEGPIVFRHRDTYFMMYSANGFFDPWYAVGYATASSPLGPWTKFDGNPILRRRGNITGPGHNSFTRSPDDSELFIVYHTHQGQPSHRRQLAIDRMRIVDEPGRPARIVVDGPTDTPQPWPSGAPRPPMGVSDNFHESLDRARWTIVNERPDQWRIDDGRLIIQTLDGDVHEIRYDLKNLLLTHAPSGDFDVTTHVTFMPLEDFEHAAIYIWQDGNNYIKFATVHDGGHHLEIGVERRGQYERSLHSNPFGSDVHLQVRKRGDRYRFFASSDAEAWHEVGEAVELALIDLRIGLAATAPKSEAQREAVFHHIRFTSP